MFRFLLALTVTLTALTFTLALTARAWGETQPPHPALRGFVEGCEGKPQPCWYGIAGIGYELVPLDTAHDYLTRYGYTITQDTQQYGGSDVLRTYSLQLSTMTCETSIIYQDYAPNFVVGISPYCEGLRIGDMFEFMGPPNTVYIGNNYAALMYDAGVSFDTTKHIDLLAPVSGLFVSINSAAPDAYDWRGLIPQWKYCQLDSWAC
ncbi:MAG: hypothetical protein J0M33_00375 [Anaerolineae bacterium]|nr:hypothetical protein [Anaerolineae bacterium]